VTLRFVVVAVSEIVRFVALKSPIPVMFGEPEPVREEAKVGVPPIVYVPEIVPERVMFPMFIKLPEESILAIPPVIKEPEVLMFPP
jgi:hypothetical protein